MASGAHCPPLMIKNIQALELLQVIHKQLILARNDPQKSLRVHLLEYRLLEAFLYFLQTKILLAPPFNFEEELRIFVLRINKMVTSKINFGLEKDLKCYLIKALQLLLNSHTYPLISQKNNFLLLKIMTYNNISCLYKQQNHLQLAFDAINQALKAESLLNNQNTPHEVQNSVTTMINKAAILSAMKKNGKAIGELKQAYKKVEKNFLGEEVNSSYLKGMLSYNIAVEYENLGLKHTSKKHYKKAISLSKIINNKFIIQKSKMALGLKDEEESVPAD